MRELALTARACAEIQDHAAGSLLAEEAGGVVTDVLGKPLDFGQGRTLRANKGVVVTSRGVNTEVIRVVGEVLGMPNL